MTGFRFIARRGRRDAELREEIRTHLDMAVRDRMARGESREEAEQAARREFGNELLVREVTRDMWGGVWLEQLVRDLRYALRGLARSPGLTLGVFLTLGLGLGANAAVCSLLDRLFLRQPEGVLRPAAVRRLYRTGPDFNLPQTITLRAFTYPELEIIDSAAGGEAIFAGYALESGIALGRDRGAPNLSVVWAGRRYFDVLGVRPERGRFFAPDEQIMGGSTHVVVVSDALWRGRLGGDAGVLGHTLEIGGEANTIIGVAARGFRGIDVDAADAWLPLSTMRGPPGMSHGKPIPWYEADGSYVLDVIARARPGVDLRPATARGTAALRAYGRSLQSADSATTLLAGPLNVARGPGKRGEAIPIAERLSAVALLILLIACANVANLLLLRALRRRREIAVRLALGISRRRLMAQIVTEALLLALLAGGGALLLGMWGGQVLRALLLPGMHWAGPVLGAHAVLAVVAAALACGLATGLVPALQATRPDVVEALKGGAREGAYHASRVRDALVIIQTALSVVLVVGAALFARSLEQVEGADIGYDVDRLVFASVPSLPGAQAAKATAALEQAAERLHRLRAVENVALAASSPMRGVFGAPLSLPGRGSLPLSSPYGYPLYSAVSPEFFATTGMRVLAGRSFRASDRDGSPPVAIVNRTMARVLWPREGAIGKCLELDEPATSACTLVVGVVENGRLADVVEDPRMLYYLPLGQAPGAARHAGTLIIRSAPGRSAAVAAATERTLRQLRLGATPQVQRMAALLAPQYRPWRLGAALLGALGLLALLVAAVGVYSALANVFRQRRHEIGVRIALGADRSAIIGMVLGEGLRLILIGVVVGCGLALLGGRLVAAALYDTSAHDPRILAGAALTLVLTAMAAVLAPAWRASAVDPARELRAE